MKNQLLSDHIRTSVQDVNKTIGNEYAYVTRVNNNGTVNIKFNLSDTNNLRNIPTAANITFMKGDKVVVIYLDNDSNKPFVIANTVPHQV